MTSEYEEDKQILEKIKRSIATDNYVFSPHALERVVERGLSEFDAVYILKTGKHERKYTTLNHRYQVWRYAISGVTVDGVKLRVIVEIEGRLVVITVINIKK